MSDIDKPVLRKVIGLLILASIIFFGRDIYFALQNDVWLTYQPYDLLKSLKIVEVTPTSDWARMLLTIPLSGLCLLSAAILFFFCK